MLHRYTKLASSAHAFVINQFGISAFKQADGSGSGAYTASTFNFYIFPEPPSDGGNTQVCTCMPCICIHASACVCIRTEAI